MPMKITDKYDGSTKTEGKHHMAIKAISAKRRKELLSLDDGMAERIKEIMEKQGILDRDLARALDVADRTIYNWKTTGQVSRKLLPLLAEYLNTTTEFLVTGEEAHTFQKISGDDNVVQMQHNVEHGDISRTTPNIVMRYVGIYELDEISNAVKYSPSEWLNSVKAFAEKPSERTCLAITANKDKLHMPGMPHNNHGFVLRMEPDRSNDDDVFVLPADFENWRQDCRVIGVATWMSHWLDDVALRHHTGLWERLDRVYEGRRLRDERWNYLEPFNPD